MIIDRNVVKHNWLIFISFLILVILILFGMVKSKIYNSHIQFKEAKVSKQIEAVIIGPTAGEYGYETRLLLGNNNGKPINSYSGAPEKATIVGVIEKLKQDYPNLKKVGLMVGWYGNSIDAGKIKIVPKVVSRSSLEWRVAEYDRNSANLVNIDVNDKPTWTGTPTDKSVVELCRTLKKIGLSVTIYPMLFLDIPEKLWRGKIRGHSNADIRHFFEEYDKFILHYASLNHEGSWLKDNIEGFIVGSELEGLTNYYDEHNNFLAVDHLVELAGKVRKIVGSNVKISYAANWSEYHHSTGGWYHLDKHNLCLIRLSYAYTLFPSHGKYLVLFSR